MEIKNLIYEKEEFIAIVTINRQEKRNALNIETRKELKYVLEQVQSDKEIRVLVITGAGEKAFIAGADINELRTFGPFDMEQYIETLGHGLYSLLERLDIPVIAMVNGFCLGGGCELAMACDIRIASENAKFGQPEVLLGIIPGGGGTQRLPQLIGLGRAKELLYTGDLIDAREAERMGLVNRVVPLGQLREEVMTLAKKISARSPITIRLLKKVANKGFHESLRSGLEYEKLIETICFTTEDHTEGLEAFLQKRTPRFKGK